LTTLFKTRESRIFKDPQWLQPLSDPPNGRPLCRDPDLELMALNLEQVFTTGQATNLFICGKPGSGKTVCLLYLLDQIQKHAEESDLPVVSVYVNAGRTRTPYFTMLELVRRLGHDVPDSGWQMFRLKQVFSDFLRRISVVIGIDEVDALLLKEKEPLIYYLNRQPGTTLILVSNRLEDATTFPERAQSTLRLELIGFQPYTMVEAEIILQERVERAFQPNVISKKLLRIVAEAASTAGDIRLGFSILLSAGVLAEREGRARVDFGDVERATRNEAIMEQLQAIKDLKKKLKLMNSGWIQHLPINQVQGAKICRPRTAGARKQEDSISSSLELEVGLVKEFGGELPEEHLRSCLGCADMTVGRAFVLIDQIWKGLFMDWGTRMDISEPCVRCDRSQRCPKVGLFPFREVFIGKVSRITLHELLHLCGCSETDINSVDRRLHPEWRCPYFWNVVAPRIVRANQMSTQEQ